MNSSPIKQENLAKIFRMTINYPSLRPGNRKIKNRRRLESPTLKIATIIHITHRTRKSRSIVSPNRLITKSRIKRISHRRNTINLNATARLITNIRKIRRIKIIGLRFKKIRLYTTRVTKIRDESMTNHNIPRLTRVEINDVASLSTSGKTSNVA